MTQLTYAVGCVIGVIVLYVLVVTAIRVTKETFGKQPPIQKQIDDLRASMVQAQSKHEAEMERWMRDHEKEDAEEFSELLEKIEAGADSESKLRLSISENGDKRKTEMLAHIDDVREGLAQQISENHRQTQTQLNSIHESIGEFRGELKARG